MTRYLALVCFLITFSGSIGQAGPAPYASIRIYLLGDLARSKGDTPQQIRNKAEVVVSLTDGAAVTFWSSLNWGDAKSDKTIASRAKPLIMVIDCYSRVSPHFEGKAETLYCSKTFAYSKDGNFVSSEPIRKSIINLIGEKKK